MGFLDFIGGIADKFTSAIGVNWKPSSLISKAGELLPVVADAVPGIGPILSKGLSAAQAIFGGHGGKGTSTTSTPTESPVEATESSLPDLSKMKETLSSTLSAINENHTLLQHKFDGEDQKLDRLASDFGNINSDIASLTSKIEAMKSDDQAALQRVESEVKVLRLQMEQSLVQNADIKLSLKDFISGYLSSLRQEKRRELREQYEGLAKLVHPAIEYLQDHLEVFDNIKIQGSDLSKLLPYFDSSEGMSLPRHCSNLQSGISNLRNYIRVELPTQEILDLYVFAVTWLLTYHKAIITLRSYLAHGYLAGHDILEYTNTMSHWNDDLHHLVHDARTNADFLLGKDRATKGRIEELAETRLNLIWAREEYEDRDLGHVTYFYDHYPSYAVGFSVLTASGFTQDRGDRGTIVIRVGHDDAARLNRDVEQLRTGYLGVQASAFTTATTAAIEIAKKWRDSAEQWESRMPFNPKDAGPVVGAVLKVKEALAETNIPKEGLGYRTGQYVTYGVSYVTNFGEGRISWTLNPTYIERGKRFIEVKLNPLRGVRDISLDFLEKGRPHPATGVAVVRRVYAKVTGHGLEHGDHIYHLADKPGLLSDSFTILDQAVGLNPVDNDDDDD